MSNVDTLSGIAGKVYRPLNLSEIRPGWEGTLQVWVNPSKKEVTRALGEQKENPTPEETDATVRNYVIMVYDLGEKAELYDVLDDMTITQLWNRALDMRRAYYDEFEKNSKGGLTPGQTQ